MKEIALKLPSSVGSQYVISNPTPGFSNLGDVLSRGFELVLYVAAFLAVAWIFWGIFQYLFSGGDKNKIGQARTRIIFALVGFILIILAFTIRQYVIDIFGSKLNVNQNVTNITPP